MTIFLSAKCAPMIAPLRGDKRLRNAVADNAAAGVMWPAQTSAHDPATHGPGADACDSIIPAFDGYR